MSGNTDDVTLAQEQIVLEEVVAMWPPLALDTPFLVLINARSVWVERLKLAKGLASRVFETYAELHQLLVDLEQTSWDIRSAERSPEERFPVILSEGNAQAFNQAIQALELEDFPDWARVEEGSYERCFTNYAVQILRIIHHFDFESLKLGRRMRDVTHLLDTVEWIQHRLKALHALRNSWKQFANGFHDHTLVQLQLSVFSLACQVDLAPRFGIDSTPEEKAKWWKTIAEAARTITPTVIIGQNGVEREVKSISWKNVVETREVPENWDLIK